MKFAGTSVLLGPTATSLIDHFRIGKPSLAGGRSLRICYNAKKVSNEFKNVDLREGVGTDWVTNLTVRSTWVLVLEFDLRG